MHYAIKNLWHHWQERFSLEITMQYATMIATIIFSLHTLKQDYLYCRNLQSCGCKKFLCCSRTDRVKNRILPLEEEALKLCLDSSFPGYCTPDCPCLTLESRRPHQSSSRIAKMGYCG